MAKPRAGKATSNYHSPLRARQAAETRRSIVEAALALFAQQGWAATALPAIAKQAGVSVDTIYSTFGTKSALLMDVVHLAIVGDDDDAPMVDRIDFAAFARGRRHERLRTGVRYTMDVYERSLPILETLREAAASDETARERLTRYDQDRRELIEAGVTLIVGHEPTRRPRRCLLGPHQPRGLPVPRSSAGDGRPRRSRTGSSTCSRSPSPARSRPPRLPV